MPSPHLDLAVPSSSISLRSMYHSKPLPPTPPTLDSPTIANTPTTASTLWIRPRPSICVARFFNSHHTLSTAISVSTVSSHASSYPDSPTNSSSRSSLSMSSHRATVVPPPISLHPLNTRLADSCPSPSTYRSTACSHLSSEDLFYQVPVPTPRLSPLAGVSTPQTSDRSSFAPSVPSTPSECHFVLPPLDFASDIHEDFLSIPIALDSPLTPKDRNRSRDKGKARAQPTPNPVEVENRTSHAQTFSADRKKRKELADQLRLEWILSSRVPEVIVGPSRSKGSLGVEGQEDLMWKLVHSGV